MSIKDNLHIPQTPLFIAFADAKKFFEVIFEWLGAFFTAAKTKAGTGCKSSKTGLKNLHDPYRREADKIS